MKRIPREFRYADDGITITHATCTIAGGCPHHGNELQPADAFRAITSTKCGLSNQCKKCLAGASQAKYLRSPERLARLADPNARHYRTQEQLQAINDAIKAFAEEFAPVSCRQIFYHLVTKKIINKTENAYKADVCNRSGDMRKVGELSYDCIVDHTRSIRRPSMWDSLAALWESDVYVYRRDLWADQPCRIQIWLEKDALVGVFEAVTEKYGVPLIVARGYASLSLTQQAITEINSTDAPTHVYYFGDHDPSGEDARRDVREKLQANCNLGSFTVAAITPDQIAGMNLPTRPTNANDKRSATFEARYGHIAGGESVEVDAIHPTTLRQMIRDCITPHIDQAAWDETMKEQEKEKELLTKLSEHVDENGVDELEEFLS